MLHQRNMEAGVAGVANVGLRSLQRCFEIPALLKQVANALGIFIKFAGVVSAGEDVFKNDRVRNADRLQVLHRRAHFAIWDMLVAFEADLANLDLWPFFDYEGHVNTVCARTVDFSTDIRELPAMLGQHLFQHHFSTLHLRGIVLALLAHADFRLLVAVEHVRLRDRTQAHVVNAIDGGFFLDVDVQHHALRRVLALKTNVVKVASVPERVEIALQRCRIVDVARFADEPCANGFAGDSPISVDLGWADNDLLGRRLGDHSGAGPDRQHQARGNGHSHCDEHPNRPLHETCGPVSRFQIVACQADQMAMCRR